MFDHSPPIMQRSHGRASLCFGLRDGRARLRDLYQAGSAKVLLPRVAGAVPEAVFLNTSGGLTGGDDLSFSMDVDAGVHLCATTQTAERAYASAGGVAHVRMQGSVGAGARLDWLPQETILFESAALHRETTIDLHRDATCVMAETIILGRHAMGERTRVADLRDHRMIRRDGRPVWAETLCLSPDVLAQGSAALLGDAGAFAVLVFLAPGAADSLGPLRAVLDEPGCQAAASGWDGKLVLRVMARDGWPLRRQMARALGVVLGRPLPRVWQMQGEAR